MTARISKIAAPVLATVLVAGALAVAGCDSTSADHEALMGEWQVDDTEVTVVFTEDELKMVGETFGYTIDDDEQVITYTSNDEDYGTAQYSFSEDYQSLELVEDDGSGTETTTSFTKISDDTEAEPTAGGSTGDEEDSDGDSEAEADGETDDDAADADEEDAGE